MRRFRRFALTLAVAVALPAASAIVLAQEKKADAPADKDDAAAEMLNIATKAADEAKPAEAKVEVRVLNVDAAVKAAMPANDKEPNLDPLIQQFTPQIRPMARAEVHFILAACSPTKEQRATLVGEGERVLKEAVKEYAAMQHKMQNGGWNGQSKMPDPQKTISEGLAAVVKEKLTPEQAALYRKEADARTARARATAVHNLVANLDEELALDADQRTEIAEALVEQWDDSWGHSLQMFIYGNNYFPNLPDQAVVPFLNPLQKADWVKKPKNGNQMFWGGLSFMGNTSLEDEPEAAAEAKSSEPAKGQE